MRRANLIIGASIVGLLMLIGLVSLFWTPHDPGRTLPSQRLLPPGNGHWFGTDGLGIDIASRMMAGAGMCLIIGIVAVAIAAVIGIPLGLFIGMTNSTLSQLVLRAVDLLYAFPAILLAIMLAAALGASTLTGMAAIGIATVPVFTRITRAATLHVMSQDFIPAARSSGIGWLTIARRHVLPNIAPVLGVQASVSLAMAILAEAALSYLGLATAPTVPTWGRMLYDAQKYLFTKPELAFYPAAAIALAVLGFNLLGDGLRDQLDPELREVRDDRAP